MFIKYFVIWQLYVNPKWKYKTNYIQEYDDGREETVIPGPLQSDTDGQETEEDKEILQYIWIF